MKNNHNDERPRPSHPNTLELYTVAETAAILDVSQKTISTWIHHGALPAVRLGPGKRLIRIRRCDLEEFITQGQITNSGSNGTES